MNEINISQCKRYTTVSLVSLDLLLELLSNSGVNIIHQTMCISSCDNVTPGGGLRYRN